MLRLMDMVPLKGLSVYVHNIQHWLGILVPIFLSFYVYQGMACSFVGMASLFYGNIPLMFRG